jgi:hypothetical protein
VGDPAQGHALWFGGTDSKASQSIRHHFALHYDCDEKYI